MPLAALAIGGITSLIGGGIAAHGASQAAKTQATAAQQAQQQIAQAQQGAIGTLTSTTNQARAGYQPYQQLGAGATANLGQMMQPGGYLATPWSQQFTAPTLEQAQATPGYQFALQQGLGAIQSSAAARGTALNTGTMKDLAGYATGAANQTYGDVYNRAMNQYLTNQNTFMQNQQNMYNRLTGLSSIGQWATGNLGNLTAGLGRNIADVTMQGTQAQTQALQNAAAARASGMVGSANAWGGALSNIGNMLGGYSMMSQGARQTRPIGGLGTSLWTPQPVPGTSDLLQAPEYSPPPGLSTLGTSGNLSQMLPPLPQMPGGAYPYPMTGAAVAGIPPGYQAGLPSMSIYGGPS